MATRFHLHTHLLHSCLAVALRLLLAPCRLIHLLLPRRPLHTLLLAAVLLDLPSLALLILPLLRLLGSLLTPSAPVSGLLLTHLLHHLLTLLRLRPLLPLRRSTSPLLLLSGLLLALWRSRLPLLAPALLSLNLRRTSTPVAAAIPAAAPFALRKEITISANQGDHP